MDDFGPRTPPLKVVENPLDNFGATAANASPDEQAFATARQVTPQAKDILNEGIGAQRPPESQPMEGLETESQEGDEALQTSLEAPEGADPEKESPTDDDAEGEQIQLSDFVEALEIEESEIYERLEIPMPNREAMSVGQLKDAAIELEKLKAEGPADEQLQSQRAEIEEKRNLFEQQAQERLAAIGQVEQEHQQSMIRLHQAQGALQWLDGEKGQEARKTNPAEYALKRQQVTEEIQAAKGAIQQDQYNAQVVRANMLQGQVAKAVKLIPEWANPDGSENAKVTVPALQEYAEMAEKAFGMPAREVQMSAPQSWFNLALLHDWAKMKKQMEAANVPAKERKKGKFTLKTVSAAKRQTSQTPTKLQQLLDNAKAAPNTPGGRATRLEAQRALMNEALQGNR